MMRSDLIDMCVKSRQNPVITVQDVHQFASAPLDVGVEVGCCPLIPLITVEGNSSSSNFLDYGFWIVSGGAV